MHFLLEKHSTFSILTKTIDLKLISWYNVIGEFEYILLKTKYYKRGWQNYVGFI